MAKKKIFTKKRKKSFRQYLVLLILFVTVYCATTYLLEYKQGEENLKFAVKQMKKKPVPLAVTLDNGDSYLYKRVSMAGSYNHSKEFMLEMKKGNELIVPFKRASGAVVMVNRGYVSPNSSKYITRPQSITRIEGVMGAIESYPPQYINIIKEAAEKAGVTQYAPYVLSLVENNIDNYPVGARVKVKTNKHKLEKVILAYGFAVFILLLMFLRQKRFIKADF